ncbi:hypothetical protein BET10_05705 [Pseudoalteromonas amylolytica]|uniref:Uncharacterized protein n=1 Tax=Pseudoalteromonas amylolytica TaxID=1859457 RepID=A0A1S1MYG0_9GAMM|nr:hypothetical protein BFC16_04515 [Pseudoalteromonas sp. JW3]OHU92416.1 hypothetical protein BET10_05705 [Pseudoalteromonas amylolytica]
MSKVEKSSAIDVINSTIISHHLISIVEDIEVVTEKIQIKKSRTGCGFLGVIRFVLGVSPKLCDYVTKELEACRL